MRKLIFSVVVLFSVTAAFAQQSGVKRYTAPLAGTAELRSVDDKYNAQVFSLEAPEPDAESEKKKLEEIKALVRAKYPYKSTAEQHKTTSSVAPPVVSISFVADSGSGIPPDNHAAVSKGNKAVSVMNSTIAVHDATTGAYITRKGLKQFSLSVGLNNAFNDFRYDPKIVYDPIEDKFICVMLNGTVQFNYIVIGFSQTNDPSGTWNFYKFYGNYEGDTTWFDYPQISITQNEFFLTGNKIMFDSSWQAGFRKTVIYQIRKADGYTGAASITYRIWDSIQYNNKYLRCLYPLNPADVIPGPSQYFLSNRNFDVTNDSVFLVKIPDIIGATDSTLTVTPIVSSLPYGVPPNGRQPDTSATLATNDGRVLGGFIKGSELQFVSTSINPANGAAAIYLGTISNFNTSPTLQGRIFSIDTLDLAYPNISYTGNIAGVNQSIISFNYSGANAYPGFGAILNDGAAFSDMVNIKSGDTSIKLLTGKEQRWGDYSGSQPDWSAPGAVWVEGIFGKRPRNYGNYMAKLVSPYREAVTGPVTKTEQPKVFPNPTFEFVQFEFVVVKDQVFSFAVYDMLGKQVDKVLDQYCHDGKNIIRFNTAPLAPGTYLLRAAGDKGEQIPVTTFIRK